MSDAQATPQEPDTDVRFTARERRLALAVLFAVVALDMMALGISVTVLPPLIVGFVGERDAGWVNGVFVGVWALAQLLAAPVLGGLSDRFGRRPVLLISITGFALDYVVMALAPSLWWLLLARVISGATAANVATAYAYVADVTPERERAGAFGLLGGAFSLGFVVGPAVGGLLGEVAPRLPFWVAAGLSLVNAAVAVFVLKESLPPALRRPFRWAGANPLGALRLLGRDAVLRRTGLVLFLSQFAGGALATIYVLYAGHRYGWSLGAVGASLALIGAANGLVQSFLTGWSSRRFGERRVLVASLLFGAASLLCFAASSTGVLFVAGLLLFAPWTLSNPAAQAIMSARLGPDEQGRLQGSVVSLFALAEALAPVWFGALWSLSLAPTLRLDLGLAFYTAAASVLLAAVIAWRLRDPSPGGGGG